MKEDKLFPLVHEDSPAKYVELLKEAEAFNEKMDTADRAGGFAPPSDGSLPLTLRTAMSAISSGLQIESWSSVAEGLLMVQEAELRLRKVKQRPNGR